MKKKTITLTEKQKKLLIHTALATAAVGGSYILLRKFLKSKTAEELENAIIRKMMVYHINAHKIGFYAQYGSYANIVPYSTHEQINAAIDTIIDPFLAEVGG